MEYKIGTLHICNDKNPVSGLDVITYSDETTDKTATVNALVENNTETLETSFYSEASDAWIDQHVRFEVEDATPPAYTRAFKFAGQDCMAPSLKVENTTEQFRKNRWYGKKQSSDRCLIMHRKISTRLLCLQEKLLSRQEMVCACAK